MRRFILTAVFAAALCPLAVSAGETGSAYTAQSENGVTVYRGHHPEHNFQVMAALQNQHKQRAEHAALKSQMAIQKRELAEQQQDISMLQTRLDAKKEEAAPKRRSRYGRKYSGNNRFFGRNGFIGNSNFSGATQPLPQPQRRKYRRKHP